MPRQETARESFLMLAKKKIISQKLAQKMAAADINFDLVYRDYRDNIASLREFANQVNLFLQSPRY